MYLDLDQFKLVNDSCGHHAGDALLKQITSLIRNKIESNAIVARLGGDEFGIILVNTSLEESLTVANNIRQEIKDYGFYWSSKRFSIGVSIGMIEVDVSEQTREEIISMADAACYTAKDRGRNCVHYYQRQDCEINERRNQMQWATRIQQALDEDRFELYYQSIVPVDTYADGYHHFEVFVRMREHDNTIISPNVFIPAAERYGLMSHIDYWVIRRALAWLGEQQKEGDNYYSCSINLSGVSIGNEECLSLIKRQMNKNRILPYTVCFEITETAAMMDLQQSQWFIHQLKSLSCKIALDDFGSGLSSFGYLKELPVDYLKIDGLFIKELATNQLDKAIVASINTVAHEMQLKTVAEFVESHDIIGILQSLNIDFAQGYYFDKPVPLNVLKRDKEDSLTT